MTTFAEDRPRNPGESATAWGVATGRISKTIAAEWDGEVAAGRMPPRIVEKIISVMAAGCSTPLRSRVQTATTTVSASTPVSTTSAHASAPRGPAYAKNPLIDDVLASSRSLYTHALAGGPPPTLFSAGDVPAETMSGIDPAQLLQVPWNARHAIASARTQAEAAELLELASGPQAAETIHMFELDRHPGNREYKSRVDAWVRDGVTVEAAQSQRAYENEVMASAGPQAMTVDEQVEAMLAFDEQRVEDLKREQERAILEGRTVGHYMDVTKVRAAAQEREIRASQERL